jgi:hypothetical protein
MTSTPRSAAASRSIEAFRRAVEAPLPNEVLAYPNEVLARARVVGFNRAFREASTVNFNREIAVSEFALESTSASGRDLVLKTDTPSKGTCPFRKFHPA